MDDDKHYKALESMYLAAPINKIFNPQITVSRESAEIEIRVNESLFHSAGAVHGAVYFKLLDDAAFFAANSIESNFFMLTVSFKTNLVKPISSGRMKSVGHVTRINRKQIIAESVVYNGDGNEIGRGRGVFVKGKLPLAEALGYSDANKETISKT